MQPFELLWEFSCDGSVISVAATPNFSAICAATVGKSLYLLDSSGAPIWETPYKVDEEGWACAISEDSQYIAVGTANKNPADGTLYVLTRDKRLLWSKRIRSPIWSVSLSANGDTLVASTWGENRLYIFRRKGGTYEEVANASIGGKHGLYGARVTTNGQLCVVASYDDGLYLVEQDGTIIAKAPIEQGFYNLAIARNANIAYVGTRSGSFMVANLEDEIKTRTSPQISQRPICGIAVSENGLLVACGSFDGRIILTNDQGGLLWEYQTKGEVWTTAISTNGEFICAGCGDHKVRLIRNLCNTAAYQEICALEKSLVNFSPAAASASLVTLIAVYLKYRLAAYGYSRLTELLHQHPDAHIFRDELRKFLEATVSCEQPEPSSHFHLAVLLADEKKYFEAIGHFQLAARSPALRSSAQRKSAECFAELRLTTAATSSWRQSREQHLDHNARNVLYQLARSYEDGGEWREAAKIYEMLLSWDSDFRNSWDRLNIARGFRSGSAVDPRNAAKDYTGITISLLGPDAPREVDESLKGVIQARSREVMIQPGDRKRVEDAVKDLLSDKTFSSGIRRDLGQLDYNTQLFLKYEFGLPEDEMKKFLETVNAFPHFNHHISQKENPRSLDIGSATGRYPSLLHRIGFQAWGIDIEQRAIDFSKQKTNNAEWPTFICGNACDLDEHIDASLTFEVITCMMGTFEHIPREDQGRLIEKMHGRLTPGGVAIISVWDVECSHLAYLSIYDEVQKELIRQNSRTHEEMRQLFRDAGFAEISIVPFCLLPQTVIYDLGIERMEAADINIAAQADLAARALFSERHGEMFLAIGIK